MRQPVHKRHRLLQDGDFYEVSVTIQQDGVRADAALQISGANTAEIYLKDTGATADEGNVSLRSNSDQFTMASASDAHAFGANFFKATRSGTTVATVELLASQILLVDDGTTTFRTVAASSGGAEANNTSTGSGLERVLTTSDLGPVIHAGEFVSGSSTVTSSSDGWSPTAADQDLGTTRVTHGLGTDQYIVVATSSDPTVKRIGIAVEAKGSTTFDLTAYNTTGTEIDLIDIEVMVFML